MSSEAQGQGVVLPFRPGGKAEPEKDQPPAYAELAAASNFSFLRGASSSQDMVLASLLLEQSGIGIADRNTLSGVVRAWKMLKDLRKDGLPPPEKVREGGSPGEFEWVEHPLASRLPMTSDELKERAAAFRLVVGARLVFIDGAPDIIAYPENCSGWGKLCHLLTRGNLRPAPGQKRAVKGECLLELDDLLEGFADLLLVVMPPENLDGFELTLLEISRKAREAVWLGAVMSRRGWDKRRLAKLKEIAAQAGVPLIAVNDALYHSAGQRDLHDVMTCIREGVTMETAGRLLEVNAEHHLKTPREMARLFRDAPEAIAQTQVLLDMVQFDLKELTYEYPDEPVPPGWTDEDYLADRVKAHAEMRYPHGIPTKVSSLLAKELAFIRKKNLARYFLTLYDIVRWARNRGILCQGRGSAANSVVCYVLSITSVDPEDIDVLFERFMSSERNEPPDIDVDFEHERREEVIQYIYERYTRDRAGIAATVIHYRPRSAMREVGKVMGLTDDVTARLAGLVWGSWGGSLTDEQIVQAGFDPHNEEIRRALNLAGRLLGFPRHLSQHVGGFVLSRGRLDELVPIGNAAMKDRTFIEWDKDDIDALGLMKVDILALGMLTCIRKAFDLIHLHGGSKWTLQTLPIGDPAVYDMLCNGDSLGVFQVESRAQMNMLPRLKPRTFYDLAIEVAIVRPGPIQGDMVHPYLRRRAGLEEVVFPKPGLQHNQNELAEVLGKTMGVPLFQEQAMRLAIVAAKFSDEQANGLRRAMATFRNVGTIHNFEKQMVGGMVARGYDPDYARRCFEQIKGFGSYGFPESHAAAFAQLVYVSSWLKLYHPAAFAAALLNSQPMGFYAPAQIVRDAQEHGVEVLPVDVNHSFHDSTLEKIRDGQLALRLGFRQADGVAESESKILVENRVSRYLGIEDLHLRSRVSAYTMRKLADADAFGSIELQRRAALWAVRRLPGDKGLPLFEHADTDDLGKDTYIDLPPMPKEEQVAVDYQTLRLSMKGHPVESLRPALAHHNVLTCQDATARPNGAWVRTAGLVLVRQRPGNGKAIFITLEDETGIVNVIMWARVFERFRREAMGARLLMVEGRVQKSVDGVVHVLGVRLHDRSADLQHMLDSDLAQGPVSRPHHPRNVRLMPKSRDFH